MSELKSCPFCGCDKIRFDERLYVNGGSYDCVECGCSTEYNQTQEQALVAWNTRAESPELATLREQVKLLREAMGWLVNEMDCRDDEFGGCLFTRQDFKIARDALEQTKPKDGE